MTNMPNARAAIILAAGKGTRMKSSLPKVMHPVGGRPMIDWSIALARKVGCSRIVVVAHPSQTGLTTHVRQTLGDDAVAFQDPPMGTGHAVQSAEGALAGFEGDIVVLYGDSPLVPDAAIEDLFGALQEGAAIGVLGFEAKEPGLYGRLIENAAGDLEAIVEAREATPVQLDVRLCNSGVMSGNSSTMFDLLRCVDNKNAKGEYYLTDLVGLARTTGKTCKAVKCDEDDLIGCDSKLDLAQAEAIFQKRARTEAMTNGVTLVAPDTVWFAHDTQIGTDVVIEPNVVFGPGVTIGNGTTIKAFSHIEGARVAEDCQIGPHARLRPGTVLDAGVRVGNFVEVKNTHMQAGAKANHLSYLGDGDVGPRVNIGAGTIFCNYDGYLKYRTTIEADAFVGSNSSLVAPITIGEGAIVGSGSVITKDVEGGALALGRGVLTQKAGWAVQFRSAKAAAKQAQQKDEN